MAFFAKSLDILSAAATSAFFTYHVMFRLKGWPRAFAFGTICSSVIAMELCLYKKRRVVASHPTTPGCVSIPLLQVQLTLFGTMGYIFQHVEGWPLSIAISSLFVLGARGVINKA